MPFPVHDRFTKVTLSELRRLLAFLLAVIPKSLQARLDWSTLRVDTIAYTGPDLQDQITDLVVSVAFKEEFYKTPPGEKDRPRLGIHILLEHKSGNDPALFLQLHNYIGAIASKEFAATGRYACVGAIVFYTGQAKWALPLSWHGTFEWDVPADAEGWLFDMEYRLYSVCDEPEDRLAGDVALRAGTLLMKYAHWPAELEARLPELYADMARGGGLEYLEEGLCYTQGAVPEMSLETMRVAAELAAPGKGSVMAGTLYEKARAEGRNEGRVEGRVEGRAEGRAEGEALGRIKALLDMASQGLVSASQVQRMIEHYQAHGDLTADQAHDALVQLGLA